MGLNFHVRCKSHRVVGMIARGHESAVLHRFYLDHALCRRDSPNAVEIQADEESEQPWMRDLTRGRYVDLGLLTRKDEKTDARSIWVGFHWDFSAVIIFDDELQALRYAEEHHMEVRNVPLGQELVSFLNNT